MFGAGTPENEFPGHGNFTGHDEFNYNREDEDLLSSPWPGIGKPENHFQDLTISRIEVMNAIEVCDKEAFERAMHRAQDYFSHYNKGYRWDPGNNNLPCNGYGHGCDFTAPDEDRNAWRQAETWTKSWVNKWHEKCTCECEE